MGSFTVLHTPTNALQYTPDSSGNHWESFESDHGRHRHTRTPRTPNFDGKFERKVQFVTASQIATSSPPYERNRQNVLLRGENCSRAGDAHQFWIFKEKIVQKPSTSPSDLIISTKCATESRVANYQFVMELLFSDMESLLWLVLCLIVECHKSKLCFDKDIQSFESTIVDPNEENNFVVFDGIFGLFLYVFRKNEAQTSRGNAS